MTRVFLAAGVAALAISAPVSARPGGHGGGGGEVPVAKQSGGGGQRAQAVDRRAQRAQAPQRMQAPQRAQSAGIDRGGGRMAAPRIERTQRFAAAQRPARVERINARPARTERIQTRSAQRTAVRPARTERIQARVADRQPLRANRVQQARVVDRQQLRANRTQVQSRVADRQQLRSNRIGQVQNRMTARQDLRVNRIDQAQNRVALRNDQRTQRLDRVRAFSAVPARLATSGGRVLPVGEATTFIGAPVSTMRNVVALSAFPTSVQYLYPDTPNYYYQYGDGYAYQVDRSSNLIAALIPLLAGGYMPGSYLPASYMNSYVPNYYGFNSFYPDSPYSCNRYANGVIYEIDCVTGMVEDVIPMYAGGYGVGQMLPSSYGYYNVPYQYRSMYYDTADYGYRYAPGAIYQYDPSSSMITSVAALLSPGFAVGQQLPLGYGSYNVPYGYRSTYYDTPNAWYRYNNGYIYQVDPTTQLVSAVVASILT